MSDYSHKTLDLCIIFYAFVLQSCGNMVVTHLSALSVSLQTTSNQNQIKSLLLSAQVPWWVKFLWACSRHWKKKTTNNLHMDRQCKKTNNNSEPLQTIKTLFSVSRTHFSCHRTQETSLYREVLCWVLIDSNLHWLIH